MHRVVDRTIDIPTLISRPARRGVRKFEVEIKKRHREIAEARLPSPRVQARKEDGAIILGFGGDK